MQEQVPRGCACGPGASSDALQRAEAVPHFRWGAMQWPSRPPLHLGCPDAWIVAVGLVAGLPVLAAPRPLRALLSPALCGSFPVAPPAAQFPGDRFPATERTRRSLRGAPPLVRVQSAAGSGCDAARLRAGPQRQRDGSHGLRGQRHPGWSTSPLWASVPVPLKREREQGFEGVAPQSLKTQGPCRPDPIWGPKVQSGSGGSLRWILWQHPRTAWWSSCCRHGPRPRGGSRCVCGEGSGM